MSGVQRENLEVIVEEIYQQTKSKCDEFRKRSDLIDQFGYWVLCGPPIQSPPIFIVSLNPGASGATMAASGKGDLFPDKWPPKLNYLRRISRFADQLVRLFENVDGVQLGDCCAGYRLFFRSPDEKSWKNQVPGDIRSAVEEFSLNSTQKIIRNMKPKLVLTVGKRPFKDLVNEDRAPEIRSWGSRSLKLFRYGEFDGIRALGIPHISGARLSGEHLREISREISAQFRHA